MADPGPPPAYPRIIDCEASSFASDSYPIEVAWCDVRGEIHRYLVSPRTQRNWTDWDPAAEAVHGIDRTRLVRNGWDPAFVAARIEEDLTGGTVYSDAPDFDGRWLRTLFAAVDRPLPLRLEHIEELLIPMLRRTGELVYQAVIRIDELKRELRPIMIAHHAAGYDVGYMLALWRRARGEAVRMHHGAGRLPESSPTGTFMPVKLRRRSSGGSRR